MSDPTLPANRLAVLSLSIEYPNPQHPGLGLFVRTRLQHLALLADVTVIAPVTVLDYSNPGRKLIPAGIPVARQDNTIEVHHPRWIYPPFGMPVNVICLAAVVTRRLLRAKRRRGVDLIDAHFGYPEGVAAALLALITHTPFIVTLRGNEPMFGASGIRRACIRWALRRAAFVVSVSEQLRQFAIGLGVDPRRTRVIGNGVDAEIFHPRDRSECRRRHNLPPDAHLVVTAGSLLKAKGHHHVISAVGKLSSEGMNVYLVIVGSESRGGPGFERELRELVRDLRIASRVRFAGWVPPEPLSELMCAADVFCLASDSEGWPNVVHEATSCGTPVVTTDVGSVRDILPSETYGLIVGLSEQQRLDRALRQALNTPWDRAAIAAWGQSRSWHHVAREVLAVMQQSVQAR